MQDQMRLRWQASRRQCIENWGCICHVITTKHSINICDIFLGIENKASETRQFFKKVVLHVSFTSK